MVDLLGRLSHVDRFTAELAAIVAGPQAPDEISRLAPRGVHIVSLGGTWWAVHPILRDELRSAGAAPRARSNCEPQRLGRRKTVVPSTPCGC